MKTKLFYYTYDIGDLVYLNLPDSEVGRVIDVNFSLDLDEVMYFVMFGIGQTEWYKEHQLSESKIIM
jgi:hypothetical protein